MTLRDWTYQTQSIMAAFNATASIQVELDSVKQQISKFVADLDTPGLPSQERVSLLQLIGILVGDKHRLEDRIPVISAAPPINLEGKWFVSAVRILIFI